MIQEAIDRIVELERLAAGHELTRELEGTYNGQPAQYEARVKTTANGRELGEIITPYRPAKLQVSTLTGFIDAFKAGVAMMESAPTPNIVVHVEDYLTVSAKTVFSDKYGVRDTLLLARYTPPGAFLFDEFQTPEKFVIGLETCFLRLDGDDTDYVKRLASNLKGGDSVHSQDDGINQTVTLKVGQVESAEHAVKARVKLTPIRTFVEAAPVETEFLIRFRPGNTGLPLVALYSLGGTKWMAESMLSIKHYLGKHLPSGVPILA